MFELKTTTECELTKFVGRHQKAGKEDVPAVSIYLKISNASSTMLDMLSPTMRLMAYAPVEGQEQLPGVEQTTPILRSPDMKHWKSEVVHEGWRLFISRGIEDDGGLQMGSCKVDEFDFDLYQGGHVDCEFRISSADLDEHGAGMLWGRQKRKVFVQLHAPELPKPAIDGSVEAFRRDHPELDEREAGDLFAAQHGGEQDHEGGETRADAGESGGGEPDPDDDCSAHPDADPQGLASLEAALQSDQREQAELEAGMAASIKDAGVKPARRARKAASVE